MNDKIKSAIKDKEKRIIKLLELGIECEKSIIKYLKKG